MCLFLSFDIFVLHAKLISTVKVICNSCGLQIVCFILFYINSFLKLVQIYSHHMKATLILLQGKIRFPFNDIFSFNKGVNSRCSFLFSMMVGLNLHHNFHSFFSFVRSNILRPNLMK